MNDCRRSTKGLFYAFGLISLALVLLSLAMISASSRSHLADRSARLMAADRIDSLESNVGSEMSELFTKSKATNASTDGRHIVFSHNFSGLVTSVFASNVDKFTNFMKLKESIVDIDNGSVSSYTRLTVWPQNITFSRSSDGRTVLIIPDNISVVQSYRVLGNYPTKISSCNKGTQDGTFDFSVHILGVLGQCKVDRLINPLVSNVVSTEQMAVSVYNSGTLNVTTFEPDTGIQIEITLVEGLQASSINYPEGIISVGFDDFNITKTGTPQVG